MNNTEHIHRGADRLSRLIRWPLCTLWLALALSRAMAVDPYYVNNAIVTYPGTAEYPPQIDASNVINNSTFIVNFTEAEISLTQPFFETLDTVNYTNNGLLMANTGFQFDNQNGNSGLRTMSGSFFNPGTVSCGSVNDTTDPTGGLLAALGYAQCLVNATNITIPGEVDVGEAGLIQLTGQNVELYQSLLNIESPGVGANASGTGFFGLNTNLWDPTFNLGPNFADSPFFPIAPFELFLNNSTAYFQQPPAGNGSNIIHRSVFIQDTSGSNVSVSVYFGTGDIGLGGGDVAIQWTGSYLDPASGNTYNNYLYLKDDYVGGTATNVLRNGVGGIPANFTFTETVGSPWPLLPLPAPPGFQNNVFQPGGITNLYDVVNAQLNTGVGTNSSANGSVTNLPGRVQISAQNHLDLTVAQITGENYLALRSTNQFNGSAGALIETPFADLYLGVTNGYPLPLTISNVLAGTLPVWSGNVVAWNTRWIEVDATTGITNDYRVLIVSSQLTPTLGAQVNNLVLYDTNSIIISDTFNILGTFSANAQSLTLTTNLPGNGATSFDGELNLDSVGIFWQSSVPNLRFLTNNGAIRMQNLALFGFPFLTNVVPAIPASGTLSELLPKGTNVVKRDRVTIGTNQYVFVATLTNNIPNQVAIVTNSFAASLSNLIAAINAAPGGAGVGYSTNTRANPVAAAGPLITNDFAVTALVAGTAGNSIATLFTPATTSTNLSWGGHATLFGGLAPVTKVVSFLNGTAFINNGIFMDQGSIIYAGNFLGSGVFSNGVGSFTLQSLTATLTNEILQADGDVSITASSLVTSNLVLQANRSLTLVVTNLLTAGQTNNSLWTVGSASVGYGLSLPIKPVTGDLLGTTIDLSAPTNRTVVNVWAGTDYGVSPNGYTNNEAVEQLILDVATPAINGHNGVLVFNGASASNALYVDLLVLTNFATQGNTTNNYNFPWLHINTTNMFIYFARAIELRNGQAFDVSEAIDYASQVQGANGSRLRWVNSYAGYLSSTNYFYTNRAGVVIAQPENLALAQSSVIDSDSDGLPNAADPTPFFLPPELNFSVRVTNLPPKMLRVEWTTIPNAMNFVYYTTNLHQPPTNWLSFTNSYYGTAGAANPNRPFTNSALGVGFLSPQQYVDVATTDNAQQTNVWVYDALTNEPPRYYRVFVAPQLNVNATNAP